MRRALSTATALSALVAAGLAASPASAEVVGIAPSSAWNVDFAENKCRLARLFGEGENRHLVFFEQYWPGEAFGLTVAGPSYKRFRSRVSTELGFFDGQERQRSEPFTGTVADFGTGVIYSSTRLANPQGDEIDEANIRFAQLDTALAAKVEYVSLKQRGDEIRLLTGPLAEPFAVLNQCSAELVEEWGLDFEQQRSASRRPEWTNIDVVVRRIQEAYPSKARNRGEQGLMRMRVIVTHEGTVENCTIIKATEAENLDSSACRLMLGAQFSPALDAAGQPMQSYYVTSITYRM